MNIIVALLVLLVIALFFALIDLTRELRAMTKRLRNIEDWWLGNRETVYRVGDILPRLEEIVNDEA